MKDIQKIHSRLQTLGLATTSLLGQIPPNVRLISLELNHNSLRLHFYFDEEFFATDQLLLKKALTLSIIPFPQPYELLFLRVDAPNEIQYPGECIFARKENGRHFWHKEHSPLADVDMTALLAHEEQYSILKTYRENSLAQYGKLIQCQKTIGYYLNPTTCERLPTTRAMVYFGKTKTVFIPAAPDHLWFSSWEQKCKRQGMYLDMETHIYREAIRALIGRIDTTCAQFKMSWKAFPGYLEAKVDKVLSDSERDDLEIIWFEIIAGVPPDLDFGVRIHSDFYQDVLTCSESGLYLRSKPAQL